LQHEGPFTASAPFCSAGYAVDVKHFFTQPPAALRRYTCSNGTGSITARLDAFPLEHEVGGSGPWQILEGTGQYAKLRGKGTWKVRSVHGDPNEPATLTFQTGWDGVVDLDDVAPGIAISRVTVQKLRPKGTYRLLIVFSARDNTDGNAVKYRISLLDVYKEIASNNGVTTSGPASVSMRVRPPRGTRSLKLTITASDPLGNERAASRHVRLGR
jgi:hypothetical protein